MGYVGRIHRNRSADGITYLVVFVINFGCVAPVDCGVEIRVYSMRTIIKDITISSGDHLLSPKPR